MPRQKNEHWQEIRSRCSLLALGFPRRLPGITFRIPNMFPIRIPWKEDQPTTRQELILFFNMCLANQTRSASGADLIHVGNSQRSNRPHILLITLLRVIPTTTKRLGNALAGAF